MREHQTDGSSAASKQPFGRSSVSRRAFLLLLPLAAIVAAVGLKQARLKETLAALADTILPADEFGPAASQTGAVEAITSGFQARAYGEAELRLLAGWLDVSAFGSFANATPERRNQILKQVSELAPRTLRWRTYNRARSVVMRHYFGSAARCMAMGLPGPPQPGGHETPHLPWRGSRNV